MTGADEKERALDEVRRQAAGWRGCPLAETATRLVFGSGPATARVMLIGEAPGYYEDQEGIPFVGPAGRLLNQALAQAGLRREQVYVTNVEKFRPWVPDGKTGKNRAPKQSEINACRPWLEREIEIIRPPIIVCLGAPAARWVLGKDFKLTQQRGQWLASAYAPHVLATIHPAFVLIQPAESRRRWEQVLFEDFRAVAQKLQELEAG
jgi:DNA polymerase